MKKELIYLWINHDENNCFSKQGFNFSPIHEVSFNYETKRLSIRQTDGINIFSENNIENVSAIVGENGSGKTTLFKYINTLCDVPLSQNENNDYDAYKNSNNSKRKFVAVYAVCSNNYKIINCTGDDLIYDKQVYSTYSLEQYKNEDFIGDITHVYLTNSEYGINLNMFHNGIDHITIQNSSIKHIANSFYKKSTLFPMVLIEDTKFNALQSILIQSKTHQDFQQILDVMFYGKMLKNNSTDFLGKKIRTLRINFNNIIGVLSKTKTDFKLSYTTGLIDEKNIDESLKKFNALLQNIGQQCWENSFVGNLVINLLFELCFISNFDLAINENPTPESVYEICKRYISSGKLADNDLKYYNTAIDEIDWTMKNLSCACETDNLLPNYDLAHVSYWTVNIKDLYKLFKKITDKCGISFVAKYINVFDLGMSSGERAILNFMSRLDLLDIFEKYNNYPNASVKDNILILIDEIDLYVHPNWQKKILSTFIEQVNTLFQNKKVQIIVSSHSPIVLSDIPRENTIYLRKFNDKIIVENGEMYPQTFAASIHSLYKNSFFIENGIGIGDYASKTINNMFTGVSSGLVDIDEIKKQVDIIGEPIIKRKLLSIIDSGINKSSEVNSINESEKVRLLKFLKDQKAEIERQIQLLGGVDDD